MPQYHLAVFLFQRKMNKKTLREQKILSSKTLKICSVLLHPNALDEQAHV